MREDALAALRVINRAAGQVAADGDANHSGRGKISIRAPADQRQLIAKLLHGRPDVIEELNFSDRFETALSHAKGAANDIGLRERRVEHPPCAEITLQAGRQLKDTALALHRLVF